VRHANTGSPRGKIPAISSTLKLTLWFIGLVVFIYLDTALFFYCNPRGIEFWLARRALTQAEFDRQQLPVGEMNS